MPTPEIDFTVVFFSIVSIVFIQTALTAFTIWWLTRRHAGNSTQIPPITNTLSVTCQHQSPDHKCCGTADPDGGCALNKAHTPAATDHDCAEEDHIHPEYAPANHDHAGKYAEEDHIHPQYALTGHSHEGYATREELEQHKRWVNQRLNTIRKTNSVGTTILNILKGMLFGGLTGALIGGIVAMVLPRSVFENYGNTTFNIDGRLIEQTLTAYSSWPMYGIVLGCAIAGILLGGIVGWIIDVVYKRRQNNQTI